MRKEALRLALASLPVLALLGVVAAPSAAGS